MREPFSPNRTRKDDLFYQRYAAVQARLRAQRLLDRSQQLLAQLYLNLAAAQRIATRTRASR